MGLSMRLNSNRRRSVAVIAFILALVLLLLALSWAFSLFRAPGSANNMSDSLAAVLTSVPREDLSKVPIYPNATPVELPPNERGPGALDFHVTANSGDIQTFYENALPKNGWSHYFTWATNDVEYVWQDPKLALPYLVHLKIFLDQGNVLLPPTVTDVNMHIRREPDPNNIPLMTGAQASKVRTKF